MTVSYGGISHISSSSSGKRGRGTSSSSGSSRSNSIAPHLGLPSLPQCIALRDRWTERKIKTQTY